MDEQQAVENVYLDQVMQQQAKVDRELKRKTSRVMPSGSPGSFPGDEETESRERAKCHEDSSTATLSTL